MDKKKISSENGSENNKWKILIIIISFALLVRFYNFNSMGRTWDEAAYVETGYNYFHLFTTHNFNDPYWYMQSDHPPLARYLYGLVSGLDIKSIDAKGHPIYYYDYTYARLIATLMSCISIVFVYLLGFKFFSRFVAITSSVIFSLIPFFLGFSHVGSLESVIMMTYTGSLFFFLSYLKDDKKKDLILAGTFMGLSFLTKFTDIFVLLTFILIYAAWFLFNRKKASLRRIIMNLFLMSAIALAITFVLWPMAWLHLDQIIKLQQSLRFSDTRSIPEVFFGRLILVPVIYFPVMFLITTPLVLITLSMLGVLSFDRKLKWIGVAIIIWFLLPFLQTFYNHRQHGIRYIIEVYAPFSIMCALGFNHLISRFFKSERLKYVFFIPVIIYLIMIDLKISPYYLDYFNEVVGGNNYVYSHRLFQMGWWGQGIGEAAKYISSHEKGMVTVAVDGPQPAVVMPDLYNIRTVYYDKNKLSDYVISPYFNIVRLGFVENDLIGKYKVVYVVHVDKAELVRVYKAIKS